MTHEFLLSTHYSLLSTFYVSSESFVQTKCKIFSFHQDLQILTLTVTRS
ncbi:MAG: hypothetical protein RMY34_05800 [Aulosira sp. DedQUE10]|nr:hypothetical protein [Aulosira sp. DedQUE10]